MKMAEIFIDKGLYNNWHKVGFEKQAEGGGAQYRMASQKMGSKMYIRPRKGLGNV